MCESCASGLEGSVLSKEGTVKNKGGVGFPRGPVVSTSNSGGVGSIPHRGTNIPGVTGHRQNPRPAEKQRQIKGLSKSQQPKKPFFFFFLMITDVIAFCPPCFEPLRGFTGLFERNVVDSLQPGDWDPAGVGSPCPVTLLLSLRQPH